jgi:Tfp pilus assembly protein PilN
MGLSLKKRTPKSVSPNEDGRFQDININILSGKYRKVRVKTKSTKLILFVILLAAALISLFPLYQARSQAIIENTRWEIEYNNISRELNLANLVSEENTGIAEDIQKINADNEALQAANRSLLITRGDFTRNLRFVTDTLPPLTYFTSIEADNRHFTVRGETDSVFTVIDYAIALESEAIFPDVRITELDEATLIIPVDNATGEETFKVNYIVFSIVLNM